MDNTATEEQSLPANDVTGGKGDAPASAPVRSEHDFDQEKLLQHFSACLRDDGTLDLGEYILAYKQVFNFLNVLGTVFSWVASDVHAKLDVLVQHRLGPDADHYAFVEAMIDYEVKEQLIKPKARDSSTGARNLLRLHRALEYITGFLEVLPSMADADKCCPQSQAIYKKTLAKFHPWVVQKAALMAMHMLPTKEGLIHKICGDSEDEYKRACDMLPKSVAAMQAVYDRTQEIYAQHKILDLP